MRSRGGVLILLVVFVGLALLVASQNASLPPAPEPVQFTETPQITGTPALESGTLIRAFPDLTVLNIQAIRLQDLKNDKELTLSRDSDGNWIAPDLQGELDSEAVTNIARTLVLFPYARSINILQDTKFTDYGFDPDPQLMFHILQADGQTHTIAIGGLTATEEAYHALIDERDEIFQIERGPVEFLRKYIIAPPIRLTNN